jgi:AcrR family transcriptional regulator
MSPRPKQHERRMDLREQIISTAWEQIAQQGGASLNLRAIARQLGITAPAIYNYFADRDALITALLIEAYTSLGDWQFAARDAVPADDLTGRLVATGRAYRNWALTYPQRYQLIFGTPLPGYLAPQEQTFPSAARSLGALVSVVESFRAAGKLQADNFPAVKSGYEHAFEAWKSYAGDADALSLSVAVLVWTRVHGLVSIEIAGNLPPFGAEGDALYEYEIESILRQFFGTSRSL